MITKLQRSVTETCPCSWRKIREGQHLHQKLSRLSTKTTKWIIKRCWNYTFFARSLLIVSNWIWSENAIKPRQILEKPSVLQATESSRTMMRQVEILLNGIMPQHFEIKVVDLNRDSWNLPSLGSKDASFKGQNFVTRVKFAAGDP